MACDERVYESKDVGGCDRGLLERPGVKLLQEFLEHAMASKLHLWERIRELGEGGQGKVYLARNPERTKARADALNHVPYLSMTLIGSSTEERKREASQRLAESFWCAARPDCPSELAALKEFQIRGDDEAQSVTRLEAEIRALNEIKHPAVLRMLDSSKEERFIATQYFQRGSLNKRSDLHQGDALGALKAFRSLVDGVRLIHGKGAVHRDIKPHNIFVADSGDLVLGDFGIVFFQEGDRLTRTYERVGSRYWMAPWVDRNLRVELADISPSLDIYPLGKLLWLLIAGKEVFPREEFADSEYNLEEIFPNEPNMKLVNALLGKCVVTKKKDCLKAIDPLLAEIDEIILKATGNRGYRDEGEESWLCRMCGKGSYERALSVPPQQGIPLIVQTYRQGYEGANVPLKIYSCNRCGHVELFIQ